MRSRPALHPVLLLVLLWVSSLPACSPPPGQGLVILGDGERPYFHDFGTLRHGERRQHVFRLRNTDAQELRILSVTPACSCSKIVGLRTLPASGEPVEADLRRMEDVLRVPAGEEVELVVGVDTGRMDPNQEKLAVIRMRTSSEHSPFLTFEQHVKAVTPFTVSPRDIRIGDVPRSHGGGASARIMASSVHGLARVLDRPAEHAGRIDVNLREIVAGNGESLWILTATVGENEPLGPLHEVVTLHTTDEQGQGKDGRLEVHVWAQVTEDVKVYPPRLSFAALEAGTEATIRARIKALVPGMRVKVLGAEVQGDLAQHFDVGYEPLSADSRGRSSEWTVTLVADGGLPTGRFDGLLRVELDDARYPELVTSFSGVVHRR